MLRICVVEDDPNIARMIAAVLSMGGYDSRLIDNGADAVAAVSQGGFDLVLLDVMLPDMDGFEVMARIAPLEIPVIFLTARQEVSDKVRGLHLGADDYIVKPFEAMELLARVEVVLRRAHRGAQILQMHGVCVDIAQHSVRYQGQEVSLTPKEFDMLVFFLQNPNIALTRERLLSAVWGYGFEGESRTVDIHVQRLRKKLHLQDKLVTIPKLGYRMEQ
ncbi:MAG: response regulator transcription factor [Christensenellales bacterium]|jgi:DNA-binding response OmpR family regulator